MSDELANNENNVILKLDDGKIVEWQFKVIGGKYFAIMHFMEYLDPHYATLIEGKHIKTVDLGEDKKKAREDWNKNFRRINY